MTIYAKKGEETDHFLVSAEMEKDMSPEELKAALADGRKMAQDMYDVMKAAVNKRGGKICVGCLVPLMATIIQKGFELGDDEDEDIPPDALEEMGRVYFYLHKFFEEMAEKMVYASVKERNPEQVMQRITELLTTKH